jgi:glucoamylase
MGPRSNNQAPGHPGIPARWTSSAKSGVGTAPAVVSRVWFTLSHGILDEIYYPRVDYACTRDFGLIVTDGRGYFSEEKRDAASVIRPVDDGVPAFMLRNVSRDGRYVIEKLVLADPRRDVVLQHVRFKPQSGAVSDYRLYALLAPHLVNRGAHNTAWLADHKGREMLFASGSGNALALGCSAPWRARSVGFVGTSDGWQDLTRHYVLTWAYDLAVDGNVALTGEIDLAACGGEFVLALGFGRRSQEAAHRVIASLSDGVDAALADYTAGWRTWQDGLLPLDRPSGNSNTYRISTAVIRSHEASSFPGGIIASLSIPWGFNKGDEDLGGYHLVWPRDLVETAGALVAAGDFEGARRVLHWLEIAQEADRHWPQNCWLDGAPYWTGVQMDECAFPILLVDLMWREGGLRDDELQRFWPMVLRAAGFVVRNGPVTGQDRWEEMAATRPSHSLSRSRRSSPQPTSPIMWASRRQPCTCARPPISGTMKGAPSKVSAPNAHSRPFFPHPRLGLTEIAVERLAVTRHVRAVRSPELVSLRLFKQSPDVGNQYQNHPSHRARQVLLAEPAVSATDIGLAEASRLTPIR